jgi:nicotinamide-nucleotide amidase
MSSFDKTPAPKFPSPGKQGNIAEILSVGTELLLGELVDTNFPWLAGELRRLGFFVYHHQTIGDNRARLAAAIATACRRSDFVIISGGLGPTDDDLTREAIADVLGQPLAEDPAALARLHEMFVSRGRTMAPENRKQAWRIPPSIWLANPIGTAEGWWVPVDPDETSPPRVIIAMPGPPHEMKRMWTEQVLPRLPAQPQRLWAVTLHTIGIGESDVAHHLAGLTQSADPSVATYARAHGVDVRLACSGSTCEEARDRARPLHEDVSRRLARWVFGRDDETLPGVVLESLRRTGGSLGVAEIGTGGMITDLLTDVASHQGILKGSLVAPLEEMVRVFKPDPGLIGKHGLVSSSLAFFLAETAAARLESSWVLAVVGVVGPGPFDGLPAGLAQVAVLGPGVRLVRKLDWPGDPPQVKNRMARQALALLWEALRESTSR